MEYELHHGDCLEVLKSMSDDSVDSVVTDPPAGISFMGKEWDKDKGGKDQWIAWMQSVAAECLRVIKPGGHALVWAIPRTSHWTGMAWENAGWEPRDKIVHLFGCVSDDTEILVDGKWERFNKNMVSRLALSYNPDRDTFQWLPIQEVFEYDYSDTAYRIQSDNTDQLVSRNHRCLVERGGKYVFQLAETLLGEAGVPVLENLSGLLESVPVPNKGTGFEEQDMFSGVHGCSDRQEEYRKIQDTRSRVSLLREDIQGEIQSKEGEVLFSQLQGKGCDSSNFDGEQIRQNGDEVSGFRFGGREKSGMERGGDILSEARELQADQVCQVSSGIPYDGPEGRICNGTSLDCCNGYKEAIGEIGSCPSCESRSTGQSVGELGVVCKQSGSQVVRSEGYARTDLARVTEVHYEGNVWCIRVDTGAFVARRNGKVFVTGNSGFPKSLSVSKQMDSMEKKRWSDICKLVDNLDCFDILEKWKENSKNASNAGLLFLTTSERESDIMLPECIVPLLVPASEYQEGSRSNTPTELGSVSPVAKTFQRRQIETGWSTQRSGSVLGIVVLEVHPENKDAVALIAELRSSGVSPTSKDRCTVQDSAEAIITPLPSLVTAVARLSENQNPLIKENISTVHLFVRDLQNEKIVGNLKAAEALKIWLGSKPSSRLGDTIALCAALTDDLKRIILSKSEMFLSADMIRQMEFVSAINVTITESMAESLILSTADILKSKAIDKAAGAEREVIGQVDTKTGSNKDTNWKCSFPRIMDVTAPATDAAKQWDGWGTALKPAAEDWWLLRKPLSEKTIAQNVLKHGTGALNIAGCRIASNGDHVRKGEITRRKAVSGDNRSGASAGRYAVGKSFVSQQDSQGRWPANVVLSDEKEVIDRFPEKAGAGGRASGPSLTNGNDSVAIGHYNGIDRPAVFHGDTGSAARFFKQCGFDEEDKEVASFLYCSKASKSDRDAGCESIRSSLKNNHPTVKPTDLMRWLCRLVTPKNGVVLDPFAGSGSTGKACMMEGFRFIGIEREMGYVEIARARIEHAFKTSQDERESVKQDRQIDMFNDI